MLGNSVTIPGKPTILLIDGSRNLEGWESSFCERLFDRLQRRGIHLVADVPVRPAKPSELVSSLDPEDDFNCILLLCHGEGERVSQEAKLSSYWEWLNQYPWENPKLFAALTWQSYDPHASREILESSNSFAPVALAPTSSVTPRLGGLFFVKFFAELHLHSFDSISGGMARFSYAKAKHLLERRGMSGAVGLRC